MTNYVQIITAILSFNIKFPTILTDLFGPADRIGSTSTPFVSFDCFVSNGELTLFTPSPAFFKAFLSGLLPILMFLLSLLVWTIIYFTIRKWCKDFKRNLAVTNVVILFLLHPNLTRTFFMIFQWVDISDDEARVKADLQMQWYSSEHLLWLGAFGVPMILIWSLGIPLSAFIILYRSRHNLESPEVKRYYLVIYQGLKNDRFYWEFVNTARKVSILWVSVFLSRESLFYKIIWITILLVIYYRVQIKLEPYKYQMNNALERLEAIAGTLTIFGAIILVQTESSVSLFDAILFVFIMVVNTYFIIFWTYCMLWTFRTSHR